VARHVVDRVERRACLEAAAVLVNYDAVARQLRAAYGDTVRWRKVPYASESAFLARSGDSPRPASWRALRPAEAPVVLAVSRHDPRKGLDVLLRAFAALRIRGVPFRGSLVGGGPLLGASRRLAGRLGLDGQVVVEGFVPDPRPYLAHADAFAVPSIREGSGSLSLVEALEAGLPVVASACDGIPEDVDDGRSALLTPPGDVEALAAALARLLTDGGLRAALGRGAREVHARRFSVTAFVAALGAVYADLGCPPAGEPVPAFAGSPAWPGPRSRSGSDGEERRPFDGPVAPPWEVC
jgi:glycosyltransferase involved in cell wall biosynthesis